MKQFFLRNRFAAILFVVSFILVISGGFWAYVKLHAIVQPLIIHFNSREGINQIGGMGDLTGMAILSLVIVGVNAALFVELEKRDWLWAIIVAVSTFLYSALIFIGFAAIISANV